MRNSGFSVARGGVQIRQRGGLLGAIILLAAGLLPLSAQERKPTDQLAATPPIGWNSWDAYGLTIRESEYKANVDWMATHLKQFGWQYAVMDEGWYLQNPES